MREGEEISALLLLGNVFLVLCAYYFIKPLREGWISITDLGGLEKVEVKSYTTVGQILILIPVVSLFGRLAHRWHRSSLITWSTLFCMSNMVIFWALQPNFFVANLPMTGVAFYIWVGIFGVFVVAQFWAFAADVYNEERGKRMLPMVAIGATAGAASGSGIAEWLVSSKLVGTEWLLMVALIPLGLSILMTRAVDRRESPAPEPQEGAQDSAQADSAEPQQAEEVKDDGPGALSIVFSSPFLIMVTLTTLLLNWVNTNGENLLFWVIQNVLSEQAASQGIASAQALQDFTRDGTTVFYANFFSIVNWVALFLQAFAASRILKYGGYATLLLFLPVVAMFSYAAMALVPILIVVKTMKVAENATDYSLNNTARNIIWLPVDSKVLYKAKAAIDTLFARVGDLLAALTILVGLRLIGMPMESFFVFNLALVVIWVLASIKLVREHRALLDESAEGAENEA